MPLEIQGKKIHYEIYGEGKPIVILNGIMMSTYSWHQFLSSLSANNQLILVDFFDQGQSDNYEEEYDQILQVEVVKTLLDKLKLTDITLVGISYGGAVALKFAATYPSDISKLIVFNTAIQSGDWQRAIGDSWILSKNDPDNFYATTIPLVYATDFYNNNPSWIRERKKLLLDKVFTNQTFMDRTERLTNSAKNYNVVDDLKNITAKTMVIGSEDDYLTPVKAQRKIAEGIKGSDLIIIADCGHASMYEKPVVFTSLILGFVNQ